MERIRIQSVSKKFRIGFKRDNSSVLERIRFSVFGRGLRKDVWALNDVSCTANAGAIVGIVGRNGSGKTTLLQTIAGIIVPDSGAVHTHGTIISLINLRVGLQDRLTVRQNIDLCCALFGLSPREVRECCDAVIAFADLQDVADTKTYQLSQGMRQRLAFSIAMHCNPEILLLDEVFEVGDEQFRRKSVEHIHTLATQGATVFLVSNELAVIEKHCDRVLWIDKGVLKEDGPATQVLAHYTQAL